MIGKKERVKLHFYPRSPCGERQMIGKKERVKLLFLSTLSLRRATLPKFLPGSGFPISIHALLAESDFDDRVALIPHQHFYPRSPCGERLIAHLNYDIVAPDFYPRSPCGERPPRSRKSPSVGDFYPRSPCGERRHGVRIAEIDLAFLSTLSLRRATPDPRPYYHRPEISIHALLAESDP